MRGRTPRQLGGLLILAAHKGRYNLQGRYWRLRLGEFGPGARIASTAKLYCQRNIFIGKATVLNDFTHIWGDGGVYIGDNCLIAAHTVITSQTHDVNAAEKGLLYKETSEKYPVRIADNVWIGSNVTILPGVSIGEGTVVGAGAVVARDLPAYVLALGIPARVIRALK